VNPLHLAYSFQKEANHDFEKQGPYVALIELHVNNMIQHESAINVEIEAQQNPD